MSQKAAHPKPIIFIIILIFATFSCTNEDTMPGNRIANVQPKRRGPNWLPRSKGNPHGGEPVCIYMI